VGVVVLTRCVKCGRELDDRETVYPQVVGFEKPGKGQGGRSGSSLVLRERTGRVACTGCIVSAQYGIAPGQMTFTGEQ
jgi:hypothetical protein